MMICAYCKKEIDVDSLYCDQCGEQVKICPSCKIPGKGKRCTQCGTKLQVPQKSGILSSASTVKGVKPSVSPDGQVIGGNVKNGEDYEGTIRTDFKEEKKEEVTKDRVRITNRVLNIDLRLEHGDVIGRRMGNFTRLFSAYRQISGNHASISFQPGKRCFITDMNSTNGTYVEGRRLRPQVPQEILNHAKIKLANIEFVVEIY